MYDALKNKENSSSNLILLSTIITSEENLSASILLDVSQVKYLLLRRVI